MRLSEAMRLGAMMKPQAFNGDETDRSCALRAAADALGLARRDGGVPYALLEKQYPFLRDVRVGCPACSVAGAADTVGLIYHLNDYHQWTREQIADFVESIKVGESAQPVDAPAVEVEEEAPAVDAPRRRPR